MGKGRAIALFVVVLLDFIRLSFRGISAGGIFRHSKRPVKGRIVLKLQRIFNQQ